MAAMLAARALRGRAVPSIAFLLAALSSAAAGATELRITSSATLDGDQHYSQVIVESTAVLTVKSRTSGGLGTLHLRANKITVEAGGVIRASSAGHRGLTDLDGEGEPGGAGLRGAMLGDPGGGGANGGNGGRGTDAACLLLAGSIGGTAYSGIALGSAGGAANVMFPTTRGGNGGGVIILEAAEIELLGRLEADGENGLNPAGVGSGAGAGGSIHLITPLLTTGAMTAISAKGGVGGAATVNGGGGGGGRVRIEAPMPAAMIDVTGGAGGQSCPAPGLEGWGSDGVIETIPARTGGDADQAGHAGLDCGGDDCDDGEPAVHPGADETCDGVDNNCVQGTDDEATENLCPAPQVCMVVQGDAGTSSDCVNPPDAGVDGGDPNAPVPDQIELNGGCDVGGLERSRTRSPATLPLGTALPPLGAALAGGLVAALVRRRRRRARRERSS